MKKNMGSLDRTVRIIVAALVAVLYFMGMIQGTSAIILSVLAVVLLLTSSVSFCPIYAIFGINTCKK